jgi:hypothetical protein
VPSALHAVVALALAAALVACGNPEPLVMRVGEARALKPGEWGNGVVVSVAVEFENRGRAAVHVNYDSFLARGTDGEQTSVRAFRRLVVDAGRKAQSREELERKRVALARIGIDERVLNDVKLPAIEILPGQRIARTLPFSFVLEPGSITIEFRYHDDDTDRIFKTSADTRVR